MAGFTPNEGEILIGTMVHKRISADRDANLVIGLFTDASPGETITLSSINEPTGVGYARKVLTDANWVVTGPLSAYAQQIFTAGVGGFTGAIYGYFIASISAGGTPRLLYVEIDPNGPYTMAEADEYRITPNITTS